MKLLEEKNLKTAFLPVDLNAAAITGSRIGLVKGQKVAVAISLGTSLTGANVVVALKQHSLASGGVTKALEVALPYFKKVGAATEFTKVEVDVAEDEYDLSADFDTESGLLVFEVESQDLDVNGGFEYFSVDLQDGAVAKIASGVYILGECRNLPAYSEAI